MQQSPITRVVQREWRRMTSRRLYFGVCLVLPLFTLFFMATIFGNGQMENIPIGIVDQDNTATSRDITRRMSAVPTFRVVRHFVDEAEARKAVQQKEIYGYLSIPPRFEQDMISGQDATLNYYYHYALLSVGGELMAAFESSLAPVALSPIVMKAVALGVNEQQIETFLLPVQANNHPIYNPSLDYSVYLSQPFFFVLFQVLVLLITVYAVGSEIKFRTAGEWLQAAGGDSRYRQVAALYTYFQPDRHTGQLCHVRHPAHTFSRELVATQWNDGTFHYRHPGTGSVHLLPVSCRGNHHQYRIHGRIAGGYLVRRHLPGTQHVSVGARRLLSVPRAPLHRDYTNHALLWWRIHPPMAFGSDTLYLPAIGIGDAPPPQTSHNLS